MKWLLNLLNIMIDEQNIKMDKLSKRVTELENAYRDISQYIEYERTSRLEQNERL